MAVDSDEEVDYSKMDQVWRWKDGWGLLGGYSLAHILFSLPTDLCLIYWASPSLSCSSGSSSFVESWAAQLF